METKTPYRILVDAVAALDAYGWRRHDAGFLARYLGGEPTPMCLIGALRYAAHGDPQQARGGNQFVLAARLVEDQIETTSIPRWNDDYAKDVEEVKTVLRKAARKWREHGRKVVE